MRPLLSHLAWLKNLLCYMIHYGTYRGAVVGLRAAVVRVRGAAVGVRGAAVGNIGIPTYVISRGAVVSQPFVYRHISFVFTNSGLYVQSTPPPPPQYRRSQDWRNTVGLESENIFRT